MEKEMKKLLLVAISVGVFLIVIVSAAILVLTPKVQTEQPAFRSSQPVTAGKPVQDQRENPVFDNNQETTFNINGEGTNPSVNMDKSGSEGVTIQVLPKQPITAGVPAEPSPAAKTASKPAETPAPKPAANSASTAKPVSTAAKPAAAKPAASTVKPAPAKNDYWVQTGAFTAKIRAEDAKEKLASKGITSIIENRIIDGKNWYRVRLGPYTSENEAKYWLALVQSIDGFDGSQIRQTAR